MPQIAFEDRLHVLWLANNQTYIKLFPFAISCCCCKKKKIHYNLSLKKSKFLYYSSVGQKSIMNLKGLNSRCRKG